MVAVWIPGIAGAVLGLLTSMGLLAILTEEDDDFWSSLWTFAAGAGAGTVAGGVASFPIDAVDFVVGLAMGALGGAIAALALILLLYSPIDLS